MKGEFHGCTEIWSGFRNRTIKVYKEGQGTVLKEKNRIAIRKTELVAFGDEAYALYERCPEIYVSTAR